MQSYKYSVLTFIFGNYECLHDVLDIREDVEYICVTDNRNIKSSTWKIVYDDINVNYTSFRKVVEVRYNPFKYVHTDICFIIDGSIQIKKFPYKLCYELQNGTDIISLVHPARNNLITELDIWNKIRHLPGFNVNVCLNLLDNFKYDRNYKGLFQTGIIGIKNNNIVQDAFKKILTFNNGIADKNNTFRVDQIIYSFVLNKFYSGKINLIPLTSNELNGDYFCHYRHNSNNLSECKITNKIDYLYVFNKLVACKYIDNIRLDEQCAAAICNYNTSELTNNVIRDLFKYSGIKNIIVLDNSDKEKFILHKEFNDKNIKIIDNTKQQVIPFNKYLSSYNLAKACQKNNYASLKHTISIQFLLNMCHYKYMLLCDSDIIINRKIDFIEDGYVTIADIEYHNTATQNMNKNCGMTRFTPFIQLFNIDMINRYSIKYFDTNRIHGIEGRGMLYDTGAALYETVNTYNIPYKKIDNMKYITHLGHGSWKI